MQTTVSKKRILVLTENFPPVSGGSGRWFWELYSRLPNDQIVIVTNEHDHAQAFDITTNMKIVRMPLCCAEWGFRSLSGIRFYLHTAKELYKLVKQYNIDEIHCGRVIHEGVSSWILSLFTRIPYICYVHGEDVETAATSGEHNLMVKQVCSRANYIICNSYNSANIVKRLNYADDAKLHILHPGVDTERFSPAPADESFKTQMGWTNKRVIITVGRLQKRKGQDKMIEAIPEILKAHPDILYVVVGDGSCLDELQSLAHGLNLEKNIQFLTDLSDQEMIQCYQQCDLFILPNRTIRNDIEGFGMVLVEAQACGKPVIAGDSGGTRETMLIDKTGLIVDCTDSHNIANAIIDLMAQPEYMAVMGQAGRQYVVENLDWQVHRDKAAALFGLS